MELKRATPFKVKVRLTGILALAWNDPALSVKIQKQGLGLNTKVLVEGDWAPVSDDVYDLLLSAGDTDTNGHLFVRVESGGKVFRGLFEVVEKLEADTFTLVGAVQTLVGSVETLCNQIKTLVQAIPTADLSPLMTAVDALPILEEIEASTVLAKEATVNTRLAAAAYTAPANADITAIKAKTDNLPADPASNTQVNTRLATAGYTAPDNAGIAAVKAKTDNLPAAPASEGSVTARPTLAQIEASAVLAKEATVTARPTLATIEGSAVLAKEATVNTRLAAAAYTAPDNTSIGNILTRLGALNAASGGGSITAIWARALGVATFDAAPTHTVATIGGKTTNLPAAPAAVGDVTGARDTVVTHLTDVKGTGFTKDTNSLVNLLRTSGYTAPDNTNIGNILTRLGALNAAAGAGSIAAIWARALGLATFDAAPTHTLATVGAKTTNLPADPASNTQVNTRLASASYVAPDNTSIQNTNLRAADIQTTVGYIWAAVQGGLVKRTENAVFTWNLLAGYGTSGNPLNLQTVNDALLSLNEGTNGLEAMFEFVTPAEEYPAYIGLVGRYDGLSTAHVYLQIKNYQTDQWESLSNTATHLYSRPDNRSYVYPIYARHFGKQTGTQSRVVSIKFIRSAGEYDQYLGRALHLDKLVAVTTNVPLRSEQDVVVSGGGGGGGVTLQEIENSGVLAKEATLTAMRGLGFVSADSLHDIKQKLNTMAPGGGGGVTLAEIEASTVLAKEATVVARPTLAQIEGSGVLAKEATVAARPTNPVLATDPRLDNLDVAVSTRATPADVQVTVEPTPVTVNPTPVTVNPTLTQEEHDHLLSLQNPDLGPVVKTADPRLAHLDAPVSSRATPADVETTVNPTPVTVNPTLTVEEHDKLMSLGGPVDLTGIARTTDVTAARDAVNAHTDEAVATIPGGGGGAGLTQEEHDHLLGLENANLTDVAKKTDLAALARLDVPVSTRAAETSLTPLAKETTLTAIKGAGWVASDDNLHAIRNVGGAGGGGGGLTPTQEETLYDIHEIVERLVPAGSTTGPVGVTTGADFAMQATLAQRLIEKNGAPMEVVYYDDPIAPDPLKPWEAGEPIVTSQNTRGVFLTAKHIKYGLAVDEQADADGVHSQERRVLIAATTLTQAPNVKCELVANGERWKIVSVVPLRPGGVDIIYTLQVRR